MSPVPVRRLNIGDEVQWRRLWAGFCEFYQTSVSEEVTQATWQRLLMDRGIHGLCADLHGDMVGFVHYLFHPATWSAQDYCYLDDLYVASEARGSGVGRALIEGVYREADRMGAARVYWFTHHSNHAARRLYDRLGCETGFIRYHRQ